MFLICSVPGFGQSLTEIENELAEHLENISKYGTYGGGYDDSKIYAENREFKKKLLKYGERADTLKYAFPKLEDKMMINTSKDGRLRIYSWDEQTGGTMHDYDTVYQFLGSDGKVRMWAYPETDEEMDVGPYYHTIFQMTSGKQTIYLAVSTFVGSTSIRGQSLHIVKIAGNKLDLESKLIRTGSGLQNSIGFSYDFFSIVDQPERSSKLFVFDEKKREFRFPVIIEDAGTPQGRVTDKNITYRFNGKYFVKVK